MNRASSHELDSGDIKDQPSDEPERGALQAQVSALQEQRRVMVGLFQTLTFENRDTVRCMVQEQARHQQLASDDEILAQLRANNPRISRPGRLSATLSIELTSDEQRREWLPRLIGIEESYELHLGPGHDVEIILCEVDDSSLSAGEGDGPTSHAIWWPVTTEQARRLAEGPARVVCTHPSYLEVVELDSPIRASLTADLV